MRLGAFCNITEAIGSECGGKVGEADVSDMGVVGDLVASSSIGEQCGTSVADTCEHGNIRLSRNVGVILSTRIRCENQSN